MAAHMSKDELREDPILERIQSLVGFGERNVRWLIAAAVVVAIAIIAVIALQKGQARSGREAAQALSEAQASYFSSNYAMAESQLRELLDDYGGSSVAGAAQLFLGHAQRDQARPSDALEAYARAVDKLGGDPELQSAAYRGRATALLDLGRFDEASRAFEDAAQRTSLQRVDDLLAAGRAALRAGDAARAKQLLGGITDKDAGDRIAQVHFLQAQADASQR